MICNTQQKHGIQSQNRRISATERAVDTPRATHSPRRSVRQREQWTHPVPHTPRTEGEEDHCDGESSGHTYIVPHVSRVVDQCDRESSGHTPCHTLPAQQQKKTGLQLFEEPACSRESKDTLHYAVNAVVNSVSSRKPIQRSLRGTSSQPA